MLRAGCGKNERKNDRGTGLAPTGDTAHTRAMATVKTWGPREMFVDERGDALRATWHPEVDRVTLSLWRGDECRATFPLALGDAARLSAFLTLALGAATTPPPADATATSEVEPARGAERAPRG
jgi:hypothetical protein